MLVLVYHGKIVPVFNKMGWVGVDLFFVLSGFLISGLLYSEYKRRGTISPRRFFIRRGLKIYPAFYVMILVTFVAQRVSSAPAPLGAYLREIFFIQNYSIGIWQHTWSLGVEEHFYIFLPIFLLVLVRFSGNRKNPFRGVPYAFGFIAVICLLLRAGTIYMTPPAKFASGLVMNPTHDRMDSLFFGVLLGYLYHFHPSRIEGLFNAPAKRILIGLLTAVLLSCCFIFARESHFLLTLGFSFLYLGFGGLLLMSMQLRNLTPSWLTGPAGRLGTAFAFVGTYSYSIYLWHIPFGAFAPGVVRRLFHVRFDSLGQFWFYLIGSVLFGILMARLIEFPVLKLRDRVFPATQPRAKEATGTQKTAVAATFPLR